VNAPIVRQMLASAMQSLTGERTARDAWARFFSPQDVVGIKVNCSGAPQIRSSPELVGAIAQSLTAIDIPAKQIYVYERFEDQVRTVNYPASLPPGVNITTAEHSYERGTILGYDPHTYVESSFFGEDDTRSNLFRLAAERFTKIINVPTAKEHQASGVTGCLKNLAYGSFSNVARSHQYEKTFTYSFIGTLAAVEPLPSRVVLNVMDALASIWHGGPIPRTTRFRFYPRQLMVGTDPVAIDHKLLDLIEAKRKAEGAVSLFDRSPSHLGNPSDPNFNRFIREPGHIEYASTLGLGVYDSEKIRVEEIEL
jgi:hypothetical protein